MRQRLHLRTPARALVLSLLAAAPAWAAEPNNSPSPLPIPAAAPTVAAPVPSPEAAPPTGLPALPHAEPSPALHTAAPPPEVAPPESPKPATPAAPSGPPPATEPPEPPKPATSPPPGSSAAAFTVVVTADRPQSAASAQTVRDRDLQLRPIQRVSDLLRVVPGLLTVQHAGGGKANQYLLRGFDADHGTDVAFMLDGIPINMVTHGHGQGFSDMNFIIPELIERIEITKGPYFAEQGDFATAGAVNLVTRKSFAQNQISFSVDTLAGLRALGVASPHLTILEGRLHPLLVAEVSRTNGPFQNPEDYKKYNIFGKLTYDISPQTTLSFATSSYGGSWNASGQIPTRAVDSGLIDFYGSLDPTEGGASSRHNAYLSFQHKDGVRSDFSALVYFSLYSFKLYSNFTFFSADPVRGDEIEQGDDRSLGGMKAQYRRRFTWRWLTFDTTLGASVRHDSIHNTLYHAQAQQRLEPIADHDILETSLGAFLKEEIAFSRYVRLVAGLRADYFVLDVTDRRERLPVDPTLPADPANKTSGVRGAGLFSPKASLIVSPHRAIDLFINFGYGFHSNDGRGVVRGVDPVTPLTPALGYEIGARTRVRNRLDLALALWGLDLDSELVWSGDEGTTEESGKTRRIGLEFESRLRIVDWLHFDLDFTANDARFRENAGNGNAVALAPRFTLSSGLSVRTPFGLRGSLRFVGITPRPATEDEFLTAEGTYLLDAFIGYRWRFIEVSASIENILNQRYKQAQFATTARLASEPPLGAPPPPNACPSRTRAKTDGSGNFIGCEDVDFTPGYPVNARFTVSLFF